VSARRRLVGGRDDRSFPAFLLPKYSRPGLVLRGRRCVVVVAAAGSARWQRLKTGGQPRTSRGATEFRQATALRGSVDSAEIAVKTPRIKVLMSLASAGMRKFTAASIAGSRA